jgi:hypothetical protein
MTINVSSGFATFPRFATSRSTDHLRRPNASRRLAIDAA